MDAKRHFYSIAVLLLLSVVCLATDPSAEPLPQWTPGGILEIFKPAEAPAQEQSSQENNGAADPTTTREKVDGTSDLHEAIKRHAEAVKIFHCRFKEQRDTDFDGWPDGWTRQKGRKYPLYVKIAIDEDSPPGGGRSLRIDLDGGCAAAYSPPIPVRHLFGYVLEARIKAKGLVHDRAYMSLSFYDIDMNLIEKFKSNEIKEQSDWAKIKIGPISTDSEDVRLAVIGFHLKPMGDDFDLTGSASIGDIWFARIPRMRLFTEKLHNVYNDPTEVKVTCRISGILERDPMMQFELIDVGSTQLATMEERLQGEVIALKKSRVSQIIGNHYISPEAAELGYCGSMTWRPPVNDYGFYKVRVKMIGSDGLMQQRIIPLVVIRDLPNPRNGEFGWALPKKGAPLSMQALVGLLPQVGVNWVKYPVWFSEEDSETMKSLRWFADRLEMNNIRIIGVLDRPPEDKKHLFDTNEFFYAANIFNEPKLWGPVLRPVTTHLSLKIRWWQIGFDDDKSFMGDPEVQRKVAGIKSELGRFGQNANIGFPWGWLFEPPNSKTPPWAFLSMSSDPVFTASEVKNYLKSERNRSVGIWTVLKPISKKHYNVEERAKDMVLRMANAKMYGAKCVFIPRPFDPDHGLMTPDGMPAELLLPWRTASHLLANATEVGEIQLPNGSDNHVLAKDGEAMMIVWNKNPTTEELYLGENIEQIDLWGRSIRPKNRDGHQVIEVGPLPTFITGLNLPVAKLRASFKLQKKRLNSTFGTSQRNHFEFDNAFGQAISGTCRLNAPDVWKITPKIEHFKAAEGDHVVRPFEIFISSHASTGEQPVNIHFEIAANRDYSFRVYRNMEVGMGDISLDSTWRLNDKGGMVVEIHLTNKTDQFVNFKCTLKAHGRRRVRRHMINVPRGRTSRTCVLPDGQELIGKRIWIQAEELDGNRVLNYYFDINK